MAVDILCIGHAAFDLCMAVEAFPAENSKCEAEELLESGGGPAANAAYLLASWGVGCAFAGLIGDDDYGRRIEQEFRQAGVDISLLEIRPGHVTPLSIILANKQSGSRTVVNRKLQGPSLHLDEAALQRFSPTVLLLDGHELEASLTALRLFPDAISILDAGSWREGTSQLAGHVDYLAASERFALQASGLNSLANSEARHACVLHLRERFFTNVVVTLGEHGLIADNGDGFFHLPAFATRAIDTTAAGDIFHGAFAYAILEAMSFRKSLLFASMTASLSVRVAGGRQSIPTLERVKKEIANATD